MPFEPALHVRPSQLSDDQVLRARLQASVARLAAAGSPAPADARGCRGRAARARGPLVACGDAVAAELALASAPGPLAAIS